MVIRQAITNNEVAKRLGSERCGKISSSELSNEKVRSLLMGNRRVAKHP